MLTGKRFELRTPTMAIDSVDGKRVALREYLIFDEETRDQLLSVDPTTVTAKTRELVKEKGQPMLVDVEQKFKEGVITERDYNILSRGLKYL